MTRQIDTPTHAHRLDAKTRAKALEAGLWQTSNGAFISLREMADPHLVNALLKTLEAREPLAITQPLAAEVVRRGLQAYAVQVAEERR